MKYLSILGSTGSIGRQALDVAINNPEQVKVVALAAGRNIQLLAQQVDKFKPDLVSVADSGDAKKLSGMLSSQNKPEILFGTEGLIAAATYSKATVVLTAVTGTVGLLPTMKAIEKGKEIALANKETLVAAGSTVMEKIKANGVTLYPVDSEHSAVWQCLNGERHQDLKQILLTASGGPFRGLTSEEMREVTPERALKHPNWNMGSKITIDSATLMNKGLEVIEAKWLFDVEFDQIKVLVHPQSIIHSMVEFVDGAVMAQLGIPDMRIPIQYALSYPSRWPNDLPKLNLTEIAELTFEAPDLERFPSLKLAYQAGKSGGTMPTVLNAANEVAVARFLKREISFLDIPLTVESVMEKHNNISKPSLDDILEADRWAREKAQNII